MIVENAKLNNKDKTVSSNLFLAIRFQISEITVATAKYNGNDNILSLSICAFIFKLFHILQTNVFVAQILFQNI
jgi:hypothetical protein